MYLTYNQVIQVRHITCFSYVLIFSIWLPKKKIPEGLQGVQCEAQDIDRMLQSLPEFATQQQPGRSETIKSARIVGKVTDIL